MAPDWHLRGIHARRELGIDGSVEVAQTVAHAYTPDGFPFCVACCLHDTAAVHAPAPELAAAPPHVPQLDDAV